MTNTKWKKGKKLSFPVRDSFGNDINFRLECQLDKSNKRFVLRWQDPTDRNLQTGKKKSKTKSFKDYETAYQYVKDFECREGIKNDRAKSLVTFLSHDQLRDAEYAFATLPKGVSLKEVAEQFVADLPNKEATINEVYEEWIKEAERSGKKQTSISSRNETTKSFRNSFGKKLAHHITFKDVEKVVYQKLVNGNEPSDQTIVNRHSGIRALMNRAIQKGYVKKDGNPCESYNGFSELPSPSPSKTFLKIDEARSLIKQATEYKDGVMLAYFSLACFSGLRPFEIHGGAFRSPVGADPLTWDDINLDTSSPEILVSEERAKTRMTRWAPLQEYNHNLQILLSYAKDLKFDLITTKNFKENWRDVVKLSNLKFEGGDADKCRRSFATYLYNKEQTFADIQLSKIMGNSPYVLRKHYKSVISAGEGKKFFKIGPHGKSITRKETGDLKKRKMIKKFEGLTIADKVRSAPIGLTFHDPNTGEVVESQGIKLDELE
jgi:hypothetical protein